MFKWICYQCNLRYKDRSSAELHEELTDHVCVNEFTKEGLKN